MNKESIVLGSGDLYCMEFTGVGEALPEKYSDRNRRKPPGTYQGWCRN